MTDSGGGSAANHDGDGDHDSDHDRHLNHKHSENGAMHTHRPLDRMGEKRALVAALSLQLVIMIAEFVGGQLTGSLALSADAGHMLTDASAIALSLLAFRFASRPADPKRTYGYYRLEILAALANGVVLSGLAVVITWEAIRRLQRPNPVLAEEMLVVAVVGLVANLVALRLLWRQHATLNLRGALVHVIGDTLGSVGVIVGGLVIRFTGATEADPVVSVAIAIAIVYSAFRLVRDSVDVLLEACPSEVDAAAVRRAIRDVPGVVEIHDLHIWTITSGMHALSAHVVVDSHRVKSNNDVLTRLTRVLDAEHHITHTTLQIESIGYEHSGEIH